MMQYVCIYLFILELACKIFHFTSKLSTTKIHNANNSLLNSAMIDCGYVLSLKAFGCPTKIAHLKYFQ